MPLTSAQKTKAHRARAAAAVIALQMVNEKGEPIETSDNFMTYISHLYLCHGDYWPYKFMAEMEAQHIDARAGGGEGTA